MLHALGMGPLPGGLSLERARVRMLDWLAVEIGDIRDDVLVIFDSKHARGDAKQSYRGIGIRYSAGITADDLIEEQIQHERVPTHLTVVSNDHRLQKAARRKGCVSWDCQEYVDWLMSRKEGKSEAARIVVERKPETVSDAEMQDWLKRFGGEAGKAFNVPE